jgi:hypothetical protein
MEEFGHWIYWCFVSPVGKNLSEGSTVSPVWQNLGRGSTLFCNPVWKNLGTGSTGVLDVLSGRIWVEAPLCCMSPVWQNLGRGFTVFYESCSSESR